MFGRIPKDADLDKTKRMLNLLLGDLEMILAQRTDRIGKVERVATSRQYNAQEYDDAELRREMGILSDAVAKESRTRSEADSDLRTQIEALQGAIIYLGHATYATAQVTANTALLTQWCQSNGFTPLKHGYCVVDNDANDWVWNAEKNRWINIGYYEVATATNSSKGVVMGNDVDLGVVVDASGKMSVKNLQGKLNEKVPNAFVNIPSSSPPSAWSGGFQMGAAYNNGYPSPYGIIYSIKGSNVNSVTQLFIEWSGVNGGVGGMWFRNARDYYDGFSAWSRVLKESEAAVGDHRANDNRDASTLVRRDANGYVFGCIFNMAYPRNQNHAPSDMIFMSNEDGYIRRMSFDVMRRKLLAGNPSWNDGDYTVTTGDLNDNFFKTNDFVGNIAESMAVNGPKAGIAYILINARHRFGSGINGNLYGQQIVFEHPVNGGVLGNAWTRSDRGGWSPWVKMAIPYDGNASQVIMGDGTKKKIEDMIVPMSENVYPVSNSLNPNHSMDFGWYRGSTTSLGQWILTLLKSVSGLQLFCIKYKDMLTTSFALSVFSSSVTLGSTPSIKNELDVTLVFDFTVTKSIASNSLIFHTYGKGVPINYTTFCVIVNDSGSTACLKISPDSYYGTRVDTASLLLTGVWKGSVTYNNEHNLNY